MRRLLTSSLLVLALAAGAASAEQFSSLEERMSAKEFKEAGLDKLSPEELAKLNAWLAGRVHAGAATATPTPAVEDRRGFLGDGDNDEGPDIQSSIAGPFRGWRQKGDRFVLTNGQVWEVSDSTPKFVVNLENPAVKIEPGAFSAWYLSVEGYNARVKVKRIK